MSDGRPPERFEQAPVPLGGPRRHGPSARLLGAIAVVVVGLLVGSGRIGLPPSVPASSATASGHLTLATAEPSDTRDFSRCHSRLDQPDVYGIRPVGLVVDGGHPIPGAPDQGPAPIAPAPPWAWAGSPVVVIPAGATIAVRPPEGACVGTVAVTGPAGETEPVGALDLPPGADIPLVVAPPQQDRTEPLVVRFGVGDASVAYTWTLVREARETPTVTLATAATGEDLEASVGFCTLERTYRNGLTERRVCAGAYDPRRVTQILHARVGDPIGIHLTPPWTLVRAGVACFAAPPGISVNGATVSLSTGPMITDACATDGDTLTPLKPGTYLAYVTVDAVWYGNQVYGDWMLLIEVR